MGRYENTGISQLFKATPVTGCTGVMASCFAYEIALKLLCEEVGVSCDQSEGGEREHGGDDIVAENYQYLSLRCADFEELLGIICCKDSKMLQNRDNT